MCLGGKAAVYSNYALVTKLKLILLQCYVLMYFNVTI